MAVDGPADRVEAYQINFPAGTTLEQALHAELSELPADAMLVSLQTPAGCVISQYRSATLAKLDPSNLPEGLVDVASETKPDGRRYLDYLPVMPGAPVTRC